MNPLEGDVASSEWRVLPAKIASSTKKREQLITRIKVERPYNFFLRSCKCGGMFKINAGISGDAGKGKRMSKFEPHEVDPKQYEVSRRRFLRNAGVAATMVPFLGGMMDVLTERGAAAQTAHDESHPLFASHPAYKFTFVNHVTTNTFFTPTIYGLQDQRPRSSAYLRPRGPVRRRSSPPTW